VLTWAMRGDAATRRRSTSDFAGRGIGVWSLFDDIIWGLVWGGVGRIEWGGRISSAGRGESNRCAVRAGRDSYGSERDFEIGEFAI
jgi:hypothetical protein